MSKERRSETHQLALDECIVGHTKLRIQPWVEPCDESRSPENNMRSEQCATKHSGIVLGRERPSKRTKLPSTTDVCLSVLEPSLAQLRMRKECHVLLLTIPSGVSLEDLETFIKVEMRNKNGPNYPDPVVASIPLSPFRCKFVCISPVAAQNIVGHLTGTILNNTILEFQLLNEIKTPSILKAPSTLPLTNLHGTNNDIPTHPEAGDFAEQQSRENDDRFSRLLFWRNPPLIFNKNEAKSFLNSMVIHHGLSDRNVILQVAATRDGFKFTAESEEAATKVFGLSGKYFRDTKLCLERHFLYFYETAVYVKFSHRFGYPIVTLHDLTTFISNEIKSKCNSTLPRGKSVVSCKEKSSTFWILIMASPEDAHLWSTMDGIFFQGVRFSIKRHEYLTGHQQSSRKIEKDIEKCKSLSGVSIKILSPSDTPRSSDTSAGRGMEITNNLAQCHTVETCLKQECADQSLSSATAVERTHPTSKAEAAVEIKTQVVSEGILSSCDVVALQNEQAKLMEENERLRRDLNLSAVDTVALQSEQVKLKEENDRLRRDLAIAVKKEKIEKAKQELDFETNKLQRELALVIKERDSELQQCQSYEEAISRAQRQHDSNMEEINKLKVELEILKQQHSMEIAQSQNQQADFLKLKCHYDTEVEEKKMRQILYDALVEENKTLQCDLSSTMGKLDVIHGDWQALIVQLEEAKSKHDSELQQRGHELDQLRKVLNATKRANECNAERVLKESSNTTLSKDVVGTKDEEHYDF
jgi:hypothetical protein